VGGAIIDLAARAAEMKERARATRQVPSDPPSHKTDSPQGGPRKNKYNKNLFRRIACMTIKKQRKGVDPPSQREAPDGAAGASTAGVNFNLEPTCNPIGVG
jgi:hypothetical protein